MFREVLSFDDVLIVPEYSEVQSRSDIDLKTAYSGLLFDSPIISANMATVTESEMAEAIASEGGLGVIHRMQSIEDEAKMVYHLGHRSIPSAFSFGVQDWVKRSDACIEEGGRIAFLDTAHADQLKVYDVVKEWVRMFGDFPLVVGNIATVSAAENVVDAYKGYNLSLKVGIGGGSMCTTRIRTGAGIPTFQSVWDINKALPDIDLIADGGIRSSGDIVKAIGAGASAVMLGSLFAGTKETPGKVIIGTDGGRYKPYRGSASYGDKKARGEEVNHIEGMETLVPYKGSVKYTIDDLHDGIRSGLSYAGCSSLQDFIGQGQFVRITEHGRKESHAHGITY